MDEFFELRAAWRHFSKFAKEQFVLWVDTDVLAALSATLLFWFAIGTIIMGMLCYRQKYRFTHWWTISARERADAVLNLGWFFILLNATWQRANATYSFAVQEWKMTAVTLYSAPFYLPFTMLGMSFVLWWMCFELFNERRRWWWCTWMWIGVAIYTAVVLRY